jgi:hypothetical protein
MEGADRGTQLGVIIQPCASVSTPEQMLRPDPDRLRELAEWLANEHQYELSGAAQRAAHELDRKPTTVTDNDGFNEGPRQDG